MAGLPEYPSPIPLNWWHFDYIYQMMAAFGGLEKFYNRFYFNSVCPLGYTKQGKNLNYYDLPELQEAVTGFIVNSLKRQLQFGIHTEVAYCLGEGKNYKFLSRLNEEYHFFKKIIPLAHPRFIMQYKRKQVKEYIDDYLQKLHANDYD